MPNLTLLDVAKASGNDKIIGLIEENLASAPELQYFPVRRKPGTSFTTLKRTAYPTTGFRSANSGFTPSKSTFAKQLCEMFIFGGSINIDKAICDAHEDGAAAFEMMESGGVMRSALITLGKQIWYGVSNDALGFPGIKSLIPVTVANSAPAVVDATGTTAVTSSSCYFVKFGNQDAHLVLGNNGSFDLPPFADAQLQDAVTTTKYYPGRVSNLTAWTGLHVGNINCIGRIHNLTADSGKGLTDALIATLLAKFPVGYAPDAIFCSRRSRAQLQASRTVTLFGSGTVKSKNVENVASIPTDAFGIPLYATDSIADTDVISS